MPRASLLLLPLLLGPALLLASEPAPACTITATGVSFGTYDPRSQTALDGTGSVRLDCRHNDVPSVSIATGGSGTYSSRRMANGASLLQYNLHSTSARTSVWGNGSGGTVTVAPPITQSVGTRRIRESTIFGRIPAGQNVRAGSYSDTMFITVTF